jgi:autotransporter translocation and assembly factor TamB
MRLSLFVFRPDRGPAFEVWAPREMQQRDAPQSAGALVAETREGFAPNLVVGHNRVSADMSLEALAARLQADAAALPGAKPLAEQTVAGTAGEVRIVAFTHAGAQGSGPLYQMTACLLAPSPESNGEQQDSGGPAPDSGDRDLIYLTGTCTVDQMPTWAPAFVDAASSVRFG